jgi:hypothetical protein
VAEDTPDATQKFRLQFHYIKGPSYRETSCHGAFGGPTPQGKLWVAFFTERNPLPKRIEYEVDPPAPGTTTVEFEEAKSNAHHIESLQGVIRHVEFSTYMDLDTARRVRDWLSANIDQIERNSPKPKT